MDYVITIIYYRDNGEVRNSEKRFTDTEHKDACVESAKRDAKSYLQTFGGGADVHLNKCYMCFDGYLYTGDYVCRLFTL